MRETSWIKEHKRLVIEYARLKNVKKSLSKDMKEVSKQLNKLDEVLIKGE